MITKNFRQYLGFAVCFLAGCAIEPANTRQEPPAPIAAAEPQVATKPTPAPPPVLITNPPIVPTPAAPTLTPPTKPIALAPWQDPKFGNALVDRLLPTDIKQRAAWQADIFNAFTAMKIPYTAEYVCGAMAVIEQESNWQADPVVPGLGQAVWKELGIRASQYDIPLAVVKLLMQRKSANGKSYAARIDALKTEREMNALFEEMMADSEHLGLKLHIANPIRTGGPMQVSVSFAEQQMRSWPYPYPVHDTVRHIVFSRQGSIYFGIAHLLQYRAPYSRMLYRFADYNAGRYSSRNAAVQMVVSKLSHKRLDRDGDLLRYDDDLPSHETSATQVALYGMSHRLGLSRAAIDTDLASEKTEQFAATALYRRIYQLAGATAPRESLPQIRLISTKITRKLTTAWFAGRVNGRFERCMKRQ